MAELEDLTEDTTPGSDSLVYTVDDPAGTAADRKVTLANLLANFIATATATFTNKTIDADNNTISNIALGAEATGASTDLTDTADLTYNADTDVSANGWVVDEDNMASNLATKVPTQQSVKAYVDTHTGASSGVHGATGSIVGTSDSQTLTNKTLTAPAITTPTIDTFDFGMGTSFPGSPGSGDVYFRTDLGWFCYYDGTRWLTAHEYQVDDELVSSYSSDVTNYYGRIHDNYQPYFTRLHATSRVATTNNGSNYWTVALQSRTGAVSGSTALASFDTSADTADAFTSHSKTPDSPTVAEYGSLWLSVTKTLSPGAITVQIGVSYRLIVT